MKLEEYRLSVLVVADFNHDDPATCVDPINGPKRLIISNAVSVGFKGRMTAHSRRPYSRRALDVEFDDEGDRADRNSTYHSYTPYHGRYSNILCLSLMNHF